MEIINGTCQLVWICLLGFVKEVTQKSALNKVSAFKVQAFLMKLVSKEAQISNIVAAILSSTQQPGHSMVTSFCLRDLVQTALDNSFN